MQLFITFALGYVQIMNRMKRMALLCLLLGCLSLGNITLTHAQPIGTVPFKKVEATKADKIFTDTEGNLYVLQDVALKKFASSGEPLYTYTNFQASTITSIDVSNPLKIMLFYKETGNIIFLDQHLAPISEKMNLFDQGYFNIVAAAYSTAGYLWLFDAAANDLIQLDLHFNEKARIHQNFQLESTDIALQEIAEKQLVLTAANDGIYFFDAFGTFLKRLPISSATVCQITSDEIRYLKDHCLHCYQYQNLTEKTYHIGLLQTKQCIIHQDKAFFLDEQGDVLIGSVQYLTPISNAQ